MEFRGSVSALAQDFQVDQASPGPAVPESNLHRKGIMTGSRSQAPRDKGDPEIILEGLSPSFGGV